MLSKREVSEETLETIRHLYGQGYTIKQVGKAVGIPTSSLGDIMVRYGIPRRTQGEHRRTPGSRQRRSRRKLELRSERLQKHENELSQVRDLLDKGLSPETVAEQLKIPVGEIRAIAKYQ